MKLHTLPQVVERSKKRVGRGHGSGKVKTSGRGTKGQKARGKVHHGFEGGQNSLIHRLPFLRGKGRNGSQKDIVAAVPVSRLSVFTAGSTVSLATLQAKHLISKNIYIAKIIGNTEVSVALKVEGVRVSAGAKKAIEKAGGSVK